MSHSTRSRRVTSYDLDAAWTDALPERGNIDWLLHHEPPRPDVQNVQLDLVQYWSTAADRQSHQATFSSVRTSLASVLEGVVQHLLALDNARRLRAAEQSIISLSKRISLLEAGIPRYRVEPPLALIRDHITLALRAIPAPVADVRVEHAPADHDEPDVLARIELVERDREQFARIRRGVLQHLSEVVPAYLMERVTIQVRRANGHDEAL